MNYSSMHHSFDIALAVKFKSTDLAILIHHFQHWVRINTFTKRNCHDGKYWTYQTRKEIQAHFPYWNYDYVRRMCDKLVKLGVLIASKIKKAEMDMTLWYTFKEPVQYGVDQDSVSGFYSNQKISTFGKIAKCNGKIAKCGIDKDKDTIHTHTINPLPPLPPSPKKEEEEENLKRKEKLKQKSLKKGMDPKHFEKAYERLLECQDGHIGDEVEWMLEVARKFNIKQVNESKIKKRKEYAKKNLNYGTGTYSIASDEKGVHICSGNVKTSHAYADDKYWKEKGL